jgi:hypothetical protein
MDLDRLKDIAVKETLDKFNQYKDTAEKKRKYFCTGNDLMGELDRVFSKVDEDKELAEYREISSFDKEGQGIKLKARITEFLGHLNHPDNFGEHSVNKQFGIAKDMHDYCKIRYAIEFDKAYLKGEKDASKITSFSDILEPKYKGIENDLFAILGRVFPDYYNLDGIRISNKNNLKAILNSWYSALITESIISLNTEPIRKEQICEVLKTRCQFDTLTPRTLFGSDGIKIKSVFKAEFLELKKEVKALK